MIAPGIVKERPILFSAPMTLKLLAGQKTQTRRIIKPQPTQEGLTLWWKDLAYDLNKKPNWMEKRLCPYGQVGDRLWVRETWRPALTEDEHECFAYKATLSYRCNKLMPEDISLLTALNGGWKPSIHMPRKASRITLEITGVKVERVEDCSQEDAIAEGFTSAAEFIKYFYQLSPAQTNQNPWCWCIAFKSVAEIGGAVR